ncbi:hypothetical protein [Methylocella silvestris]|uniref:Flagellar FliJ protein n=1 Tax=Methylocella silvestris TaxID=199596 RepID=A0A2J7TMF3_METSI|nr:hypothetical protein [Methylocella silvestris]PNG27952.1 hypothetical protein CR492_03445 [Methylocella silvestris]
MDERLRKARRLLKAVIGFDRLAEQRVADVNRRAAELERRRAELAAFMAAEDSVAGLFAEAMMRRFDQIERHRVRLRSEIAGETERRLEARGRLRRAETLVDHLVNVQRRHDEKALLERMIEASPQISKQGPGKIEGSS